MGAEVHHIAVVRRDAPDFHPGGVPVFGAYMQQALGATVWAMSSWPDSRTQRMTEEQAARGLSRWVHASGALDDARAVVVDGYWGLGLPGVKEREYDVYCVAHGTYLGMGQAVERAERGFAARVAAQGALQAGEYARHHTVAVSEETARELRELYGVEPAAVIPNAVDPDEFRPRPEAKTPRTRPIVLYPSDTVRKGGLTVHALIHAMPDVHFQVLGGQTGEEAVRWAQGDVFLGPSWWEGCSYAALQAMACGLPAVVSPTGMYAYPAAAHLEGYNWGRIVSMGAPIEAWVEAVRDALANQDAMGMEARYWSVEWGLHRWEAAWRDLMSRVGR